MSLSRLEADFIAHASAIRARLRGHWQHKSIVFFNKTCDSLLAELSLLTSARAGTVNEGMGHSVSSRRNRGTLCPPDLSDRRGEAISVVLTRIGR